MAIFVGRRRELEVLHARWQEVVAGRGGVALLAGEAGIGKTTTARQFAASVREQGAFVLWGSCLESDLARPYGPWAEALGDYLRTLPAESLRVALGGHAAVLAHLAPLLRRLLPDLSATPHLSADDERFRLHDALGQFLLTLTDQQPVLLVLDDLHWGDGDSLRLLRHMAHLVGRWRLLIVGLYRPSDVEAVPGHPLTVALAQLVRDPAATRLTLAGLSIGEVGEYLRAESPSDPSVELVRAIHTETAGNPFYTRELYRHLLEVGQREQRGDGASDLIGLGIPDGVRQVVGRRLALLSPATNRVLRVAAAFSGGFTLAVLHALTDLGDEALLDALDEAIGAGLVRGDADGYDFAHAIVRHTLYDGLNPDRRRQLHRRIAEALERAYGDETGRYAPELATQYHAAAPLGDPERGIDHCLAAAEQARRGHPPDRAVTLLQMARTLAAHSTPGCRATILCQLAAAEAAALRLADAEDTIGEALVALAAAGDEDSAAEFLSAVARALKDGGAPHTSWEPLVARGLTLVGTQRNLAWARLTLLADQFVPLSTGTIPASRWRDYDPQAIAIMRANGDEEDHARSLAPFAWRTREESRQLLRLGRRWRQPFAVLRALDLGARDLAFHHAAFDEARTAFAELLAAGEQYGAVPAQAEALVQIACCHVVLGDLGAAREAQQRADALIVRLGPEHRLRMIAALMNGSLLTYYLGGTATDWSRLSRGLGDFLASPDSARTPHGLLAAGMRVLALTQLGEREAALRLLALLTPLLVRVEPQTYVANIAADAAAIAVWELAAHEFASSYERLAGRFLAADIGVSFFACAALTQARMQALGGKLDDARASFARARTVLAATAQRPLLALADRDEGLALDRAGQSGLALLDAAEAACATLDMAHWATICAADRQRLAAQPAPAPTFPGGLTARQVEVLRLLAGGATNREIAEMLYISVPTVERHIANIYGRIDARGRAEATAYALRHGLL